MQRGLTTVAQIWSEDSRHMLLKVKEEVCDKGYLYRLHSHCKSAQCDRIEIPFKTSGCHTNSNVMAQTDTRNLELSRLLGPSQEPGSGMLTEDAAHLVGVKETHRNSVKAVFLFPCCQLPSGEAASGCATATALSLPCGLVSWCSWRGRAILCHLPQSTHKPADSLIVAISPVASGVLPSFSSLSLSLLF